MRVEDLPEEQQKFIEQLESDKTWAIDYYDGRRKEFDRNQRWYFKEHYDGDAELPPDAEVMEESTEDDEHLTVITIPTNIINSVHGIMTDEDPVIRCLSSGARHNEDTANKVARFCHGTYWINRQVQGEDPWESAGLNQLVLGWGCIYSYWDPDRAKYHKAKGKDVLDFWTYPIVVKSINPYDVYPLPNGIRERWRGILYLVLREKREIEEEWGQEIEPNVLGYNDEGSPDIENLSDTTLLEYVDYWLWRRNDDEKADTPWVLWHCVMAHGQVMKEPTPMPEYEFLPYEIFFCRGSTSESGSRMGLSFLYPIIEPVQEMEYNINRQSRAIEMYADPILVVKGSVQGTDEDIEKGPGTTIYVEGDGDAHYVSWQGSPPDVSQLVRFWREIAQDAYPPVMTGLQGGTSGLDTVALQQGGKLQTNKPRRNLELAMMRVNAKIIRLLQKFSMGDQIFVMGQRMERDEAVPFAFTIKGKDTKGYENTIVTVRGRFPQEELRNVVVANQSIANGLMSAREASAEYMYRMDPDRSHHLWLQEQILKNPEMHKFFMQAYMQLPASSPVQQALQAAAQQQNGGAGPAGASPAEALAGGQFAAAMANTPGEVQQGVQTTPIVSNVASAQFGGIPSSAT